LEWRLGFVYPGTENGLGFVKSALFLAKSVDSDYSASSFRVLRESTDEAW